MSSKNSTQDINYFEIVFKLRFYEDKLSKISLNENTELLLSEIMSYIFSNITLKTIFNEQLNVFLNHDEDDDHYKKIYLAEYEKIKHITKKIALKKNTQINYLNKGRVEIFENKKLIYKTLDIPMIYLYPSIINFLKPFNDKKRDAFKYYDCIKDLYETINYRYESIIIPENIEFYCSLIFSYKNILHKYNNRFSKSCVTIFVLTSIFYVLKKLQKIINSKIDKECFNEKEIILEEIDEQDRAYVLSFRKNGMFYIDNKLFQLTDALLTILRNFTCVGKEQTNIIISSATRNTYVNRINNLAKEQIGQNILKFDKMQKKHILVANVSVRDYSND